MIRPESLRGCVELDDRDRFAARVRGEIALRLLALALLVAAGCRPPSAPPSTPQEAAVRAAESPDPQQEPAPQADESAARETWDVLYIEDSKVGYGFTRYEAGVEGDRKITQITSEQEMSMLRGGQRLTQRVRIASWELPDGQLLRFTSEMTDGMSTLSSKGRYENGKLVVESSTLGKSETSTIAWDPSWGGFFAGEQRLERDPMKPGDKRTFMMLLPIFNQAQEVHLEALDYESTELLSGTAKLLRIKSVVRIGTTPIESVIWTNPQGETLKTLLSGIEQVTYRTTKEVALAKPERPGNFDLGASTVVRLSKPLEGAQTTRRVRYRARLAGSSPAESFPTGWTQLVRKIDDQTAEITVRAVRPDSGADGFPSEAAPSNADRQANNFLQSDDPEVRAMAQSVAPNETDPWSVACALERFVRDTVQTRDFAPAVATAADVARSREGDCTEHAVLLAALCRARGIPSRVAIGLVYFPPAQGFAYHMWTESWIAEHWIPLDATLGMGGIGGAHLKVSHSGLAGTESMSAFLPVYTLLGQLQLEVLSVDEAERSPQQDAR